MDLVNTFVEACFRYVGMSPEDFRALAALQPILAPHLPAIAHRFYDAVRADPITASMIASSQQRERMQATLVDWMSSGLIGPHDDAFYERRARIGHRHVEIGLPQHYMFTAMNLIRSAYQDHILAAYPRAELGPVLAAANKLLDVELAIMVRHYQVDSEARLLERERRSLADRVLALQTLTAGLAHEVRNPLNSAKLQLELLDRRLRRVVEDPRLTVPSQLANAEIDRLTQLLDDFLAFARPPELHLAERDVVELVRQVCEVERPGATSRGATFALNAPGHPILARVDEAKIHQIVSNLVRNAVEAVTRNGRVAVEIAPDDGGFTVAVEDDGPGIAAEIQARIYEPFFTTKEHGSGLGMSIVHSLVTLHGGSIELATGGQGTRFEIRIPGSRGTP